MANRKNKTEKKVRESLVSMGLKNEGIGFNTDTQAITYNGAEILKPDRVSDGVSYASEKTIQDAAMGVYKSKNNPLVSATDYGAASGIDDLVQWRDGYVSVGGELIKPVMVRDGKAFVDENTMRSALDKFKEKNGIKSGGKVYDEWSKKYSPKLTDALNKILNRKEWAYDPDSDPAYLAYKDAYEREGNRAYRDAVGNLAARTGGQLNSAAVTAGGQQLNYYMQQLGDRIPELMEQDYNRYLGEQELRREALRSLTELADSDFEKRYKINRDTVSDINSANSKAWQRDKANREWNDTHELNMQKMEANDTEEKLRRFEAAKERDRFTDEDAELLGIERKEDGSLPKPSEIELESLMEKWERYEKPGLDYEYSLENDRDYQKHLYDMEENEQQYNYDRELALMKLMYK